MEGNHNGLTSRNRQSFSALFTNHPITVSERPVGQGNIQQKYEEPSALFKKTITSYRTCNLFKVIKPQIQNFVFDSFSALEHLNVIFSKNTQY